MRLQASTAFFCCVSVKRLKKIPPLLALAVLTYFSKMQISVIVPTFNEELSIKKTLDTLLNLENIREIVVIDGGSTDRTVEIIENHSPAEKLKLVKTSQANRGLQLHEGTRHATGNIFWFIHADTLPDENCPRKILEILRDERTAGGNFEIIFDGGGRWARLLTWLYPKLRRLKLVYGDSAVFIRKSVYREIGGFRDLPLFEDVDLYKRMRRKGKFAHLDLPVTTSSRRFKNRSFVWTFAKWSLFQGLYWVGFPPRVLARGYRAIR